MGLKELKGSRRVGVATLDGLQAVICPSPFSPSISSLQVSNLDMADQGSISANGNPNGTAEILFSELLVLKKY